MESSLDPFSILQCTFSVLIWQKKIEIIRNEIAMKWILSNVQCSISSLKMDYLDILRNLKNLYRREILCYPTIHNNQMNAIVSLFSLFVSFLNPLLKSIRLLLMMMKYRNRLHSYFGEKFSPRFLDRKQSSRNQIIDQNQTNNFRFNRWEIKKKTLNFF